MHSYDKSSSGVAIFKTKKPHREISQVRLKKSADIIPPEGPQSVGVTTTQHLGEGHDLRLATTLLAGLLEVALGTDVLDDVFALELLLQTADGAVNRLVFADFDFDGHVEKGEFLG